MWGISDLSLGDVLLVLAPDGDIDGERHHGSGLYCLDTRMLSCLRISLGNAVLADQRVQGDTDRATYLSYAHWSDDPERVDLVFVKRYRLYEPRRLELEVEVINGSSQDFHDRLRLEVVGDFVDLFEVRDAREGVLRVFQQGDDPLPDRHVHTRSLENGVALDYRGVDGVDRGVSIEMNPPFETKEEGVFERHLKVPPYGRARFRITCALEVEAPSERGEASSIDFFLGAERDARGIEFDPASPRDTHLQRLLNRSIADLNSLLIPTGVGPVPAAGIPWYHTLFGRDALIAAIELLEEAPQLAGNVLRALASFQGQEENQRTYEEPGKIMHEIRPGELANAGYLPFTPHYGSVDATPLFVWLAGRCHRRTEDDRLLQELQGAVENALAWIERRLAQDRYIVYRKGRYPGPTNMGWKDAENAVIDEEGQAITGEPIALAEVQGYAYGALREGARLLRTLGKQRRAASLQEQAEGLRERFVREFWMAEEGYFAFALRAGGQQVRAVTSNPAHGLLMGIIPHDAAEAVVERLLSGELFSGYGIRTLSADHPGYSPTSYHRGSVWPHDTAIIVLGMLESGFTAGARTVASSLLDAAEAFDWRLPELFCGFSREEADGPVPYPHSCVPAAWGAGSGVVLARVLDR